MNLAPTKAPAWLLAGLEKPVALFGCGLSGRGARELVESLGGKAVYYDEAGGRGCRGAFGPAEAREHALAVFSPGFPEDHPWLAAACRAGLETIPEIDLGGAVWEGPLLAVTGTNGKTTVTSLLAAAFRRAGRESHAVGNIGDPLSSLAARRLDRSGVAVCEVSSFQAAALGRLRPDAVVWTNFAEDHLDRHGSLEAYFRAKLALASRVPKGRFFYGPTVAEAARRWGVELDPEGAAPETASPEALGLEGTAFERPPDLSNYLMASFLWRAMEMDEELLREAARAFRKPPHRMELAGVVEGVSFWDDSKATNFHAVLRGLERFAAPARWIGGGRDKGGDVEGFARQLAGKVSEAHLIGEARFRLSGALQAEGASVFVHEGLDAAVQAAFAISRPGDHIVLSPGFASFDLFESYAQRGEAFVASMGRIAATR